MLGSFSTPKEGCSVAGPLLPALGGKGAMISLMTKRGTIIQPVSPRKLGPGVHAAQDRFRHWMLNDALPVWASTGHDGPGLGFSEQFQLDGSPSPVGFKRMRVQARQIYVFSHAQILGWTGGAALATDAHAFITRHGLRDDGAWVRTMGRAGGVLDATADLYDLAFVLFALAWYARASGESQPLAQARRTAEWIRANMGAALGGGYYNTLPVEPGHRQQNPHMHLLEACLALFETSGDAYYAEMAHELLALFQARLHDPASGTLGEFFDDTLTAPPGPLGDHIEPGHQYEWVWLLDQCNRLLGTAAEPQISQLYAFAEAHGRDPSGVAVLDVVGRTGAVRHASSRLWPQTEALKAHAAMTRRGMMVDARITTGLTHLMDRHLTGAPRGMWREHFDAQGLPMGDKIPASTFYHLFMAYADLEALL